MAGGSGSPGKWALLLLGLSTLAAIGAAVVGSVLDTKTRSDPAYWGAKVGVLSTWEWEYRDGGPDSRLQGHVDVVARTTRLSRRPQTPEEALHEVLETGLVACEFEEGGAARTCRDAFVAAVGKLVLE